jgi:uncharacterized protein
VIAKVKTFVQRRFAHDTTGHGWLHAERVLQTSLRIAKGETYVDYTVLTLAALLHEVDDRKFTTGRIAAGAVTTRRFLAELDLDVEMIDRVCEIVKNVSFRGAQVPDAPLPVEGRIVRDADRLEALGAIGIARCFAYGGSKKQSLYDPSIKPRVHRNSREYYVSRGTSINHFYEKLFLLRERMQTKTGRRLAVRRDTFLRAFLKEFLLEWEGKH